MNTKILTKISFYLLLVLLVVSCNSDDDETIFDETPSKRIDSRISELKNLLLASSEGYRTVYFPNNEKYGGFTFFMKFKSDGTVEMRSDVDAETSVTTGAYEVGLGSTIELTFSTRNQIHKLSDSNIQGLIGTGYEGNSNFQYISNEDGKITFKEPRHNAILVFEPVANQDNWAQVDESLAMRQNLVPTATTSVFQQFIVKTPSGQTNYNLNYDGLRFYAGPRNQAVGGVVSEINFGIAYTPQGLIVNPPIELDGVTYETFTYDAAQNIFVSKIGDNEASFGFNDAPAFITDDYKDLGSSFGGFVYRVSEGVNPLTSAGFDAIIAQVNTNIAGFGITFNTLEMYFEPNASGQVRFWINTPNTGNIWSSFFFELELKEEKMFLTYVGPGNANGTFLEDELQPLLDFLLSTDGIYFETKGSFSTSTTSYSNTSGTFTSAQNPSQRVYGFLF